MRGKPSAEATAVAKRTDGLDRKAATLATFASLLASLTAVIGAQLFDDVRAFWAFGLFCAALLSLVTCVALAIRTFFPREQLALGMSYLRRFPTWGEILKTPEDVRGETMRGVIEAIAREREVNDGKARAVKLAFILLLTGLILIAAEAATLASVKVI